MPAVIDERLTTASAARVAGVGEQTIRNWMRTGRLAFESTPLGALIDPASLGAVIADRERNRRLRGGR
jgi:predicted site-specific integrase-resolvase